MGDVARSGRPKSRRKSSVESPVSNTRKTYLTPDRNTKQEREVTLPAAASPTPESALLECASARPPKSDLAAGLSAAGSAHREKARTSLQGFGFGGLP